MTTNIDSVAFAYTRCAPFTKRMRMKSMAASILFLFVFVIGISPSIFADSITIENAFNLYGKVPNTSAGICAAAATINSFIYLSNSYPDLYADLIPDWNTDGNIDNTDYIDSRDKLAYGWFDGNDAHPGIYGAPETWQGWWEMKSYWIEGFAPGTTVFDGQIPNANAAEWKNGEVLENTYPEWSFLWNQLSHGADIELGIAHITPEPNDQSHAITLTGMQFNDTNGNKVWDPLEASKIAYLDPNDVNNKKWADISFGANGILSFEWWQDQKDWYVYSAFTEIAIPEPAALLLLGTGLGIIGLAAWRRKM